MTRPLTITERLALSFDRGLWLGLLIGALVGMGLTRVVIALWASR